MIANAVLRFLVQKYPLRRGKHRLLTFAMERIRGVELGMDVAGNRLLLDLGDLIASFIFLQGSYSLKTMTLLAHWAGKQGCRLFIDVGAHIGCFTLFFTRQAVIEQIYAFEPNPRSFAQLQVNLWLNRQFGKVKTYNMALSDRAGAARLDLSLTDRIGDYRKFNTGAARLDRMTQWSDDEGGICVQMQALDDLLEFRGQNIAVKIDVEGYEDHVLKGMERLLRFNNCVLLVESSRPDSKNVDAWLRSLGYAVRENIGEDYLYLKCG